MQVNIIDFWIVRAVRVTRVLIGSSQVGSGLTSFGSGSGRVSDFTTRVDPLRGLLAQDTEYKI